MLSIQDKHHNVQIEILFKKYQQFDLFAVNIWYV